MCWQPGKTLGDIEKEVIQHAFRFYGRNKTTTARVLDISVRTLDAKIAKYEGTEISLPTETGHDMEPPAAVSEKPAVPVRERNKVQKVSR